MNVEKNLLVGTIAAVIVVVLLVGIYVGEEIRMERETEDQQGKLIARGARLYDTYCAGCHGERGEGLAGIYPPLNVEDLWSGKEDIAFYGTLHDYISLNISAGHPEQRMPSWATGYGGPLRGDQIEDVTQFVLNWMGPQPEGVRVQAAEAVSIPPPDTEPEAEGVPAVEPGQDAARGGQIFASACVRCHGADAGGTDLGPSLVGASVVGKGDDELEDAIALGKPGTSMPAWNELVGPQDISNIVAYMRSLAAGEAPVISMSSTDPAEAGETLFALPLGDALIGQALFTGADRLENGGPSCLICHGIASDDALGGGTLGPDLTLTFNKHGELGLAGVLADIGFPTMAPIYKDRPLTPEEQAHLRIFLQEAATRRPTQPTGQFGLLALAGFLVLMVLAQAVWRRRLRSVRQSLVEQTRSKK
ncbi:MAG: c-type cytochrome [Chloroflexi bacterium]|nr:c-type cytochrome [Chloroflexota bacterium]